MIRSEWVRVVKEMRARWPHAPVPDQTIAVWFTDVESLEAVDVLTALRAFGRDGRDFPPTGGQLRAKALELAGPALDWSRGYHLATELPGSPREVRWLHGDGRLNRSALDWLAEQDPIAAETVRRLGAQLWAERLIADEATWRANFRMIYQDLAAMGERHRLYEGLPVGERSGELRKPSFAELVAGGS